MKNWVILKGEDNTQTKNPKHNRETRYLVYPRNKTKKNSTQEFFSFFIFLFSVLVVLKYIERILKEYFETAIKKDKASNKCILKGH